MLAQAPCRHHCSQVNEWQACNARASSSLHCYNPPCRAHHSTPSGFAVLLLRPTRPPLYQVFATAPLATVLLSTLGTAVSAVVEGQRLSQRQGPTPCQILPAPACADVPSRAAGTRSLVPIARSSSLAGPPFCPLAFGHRLVPPPPQNTKRTPLLEHQRGSNVLRPTRASRGAKIRHASAPFPARDHQG